MFSLNVADFTHVHSERMLPGWKVSKPYLRNRLQPKGVTPNKYVMTHTEPKGKDVRAGIVRHVAPYDNELMSPWQRDFARLVNQGHNVIVDTVTSTGKTWAANLIVAHETLERDSRTRALIISPNSEVMRDTAGTINGFHNKVYNYCGTMMSTMTRNYVTYEPTRAPNGQIMVITVDSVVEFLTDPKHAGFMEWLQFVIFDEVHLKAVSECLWWTQFIPHHAQLILLSATLGDPQAVKTIVERMQLLQKERPRETSYISYYVRPIPLQLTMFKGCDMPTMIVSKALKGAGRLTCAISTDPTTRDMSAISPTAKIPETREEQYKLGQSLLKRYPEIVKQKNEQAMTEIVTDPTPENIFKVLCYLFSNDMQPVMVFHSTTEQTRYAAEQLIGLINRIEKEDPELREARRVCERFDKEVQRNRDKKDLKKSGKNIKDMDLWERDMLSEPAEAESVNRLRSKLNKWRFPCDLSAEDIPKNTDSWIVACMERGIGVYVSTMPVWLRHFTFDAFQEGKLKVLLSDSTISVGINLPIRTCVLCGICPHHLYKQASGRAGRRGKDTKGFIVHLMPEERIREYIVSRTVNCTLQMPKAMTYAGLLRLQVPANLDTDTDPEPSKPATDISSFKTNILFNYYNTLKKDDQAALNQQLKLIQEEAWPYHRMTNFIKTLPCSESILIIKLLTTGVLHRFEPSEFIDLMSMLLYRHELPKPDATESEDDEEDDESDDEDDEESEKENPYYLPKFERFPGFIEELKQYVIRYGFDLDLDRPIHHYFSQFCQGRQYLTHMEEIQDMGEWLYIFKRGLTEMGPASNKNEMMDEFIKMVYKVDGLYLSGVTRKKILE
jgi:superfamily II RNA helicase